MIVWLDVVIGSDKRVVVGVDKCDNLLGTSSVLFCEQAPKDPQHEPRNQKVKRHRRTYCPTLTRLI